MGKLNNDEYTSIINSLNDIVNGKINKPFIAGKDYSVNAKFTISRIDDVRRELLALYSKEIENDEKIQKQIANITHDLKTPIALILGAVECLQDGLDDKDYVSLIKEKTSEMNDVVLRIISNTKTFTQNAKSVKRNVFSGKIFSDVCDKYRKLAVEKKIKYIVKKEPKALISVSETEIKSAIDNVLSNAVKYTEKGKIVVSFNVSISHFFIVIKDTGKGIKKEDIPYIFDRFFTDDKARSVGGTGVGLSYAKDVVEDHGGKVYVESKEGKGSKFVIAIPRAETRRMSNMSDDKKKFLESCLRLILFPFFYLVDLYRTIYYGRKIRK